MARRSVLITGCSPGSIGEALSLEFLRRGCIVCSTSLPSETLPTLEKKGAHVFPLDVRTANSVAELANDVKAILPDGLDILINCAGMNYVMPVLDIDLLELHRTFDINVFGVVRMVQAFTPLLMKTKGAIVNVGSLTAYSPYVFGASYNASKAALLALGNTLRIELSPWEISVQTILAGQVESPLMIRTARELPSDSLYTPIRSFFERRTTHAKHGVKGMPTAEFATEIVEELLKSNKPKKTYWIGPFKWPVWFIETFGLLFLWEWFFRKNFGLNLLGA